MDGEHVIHESIGITCGSTPDGAEIVGLLLAAGVGEEDHEIHMTLPAAKALLIDLRDAIDICMKHQQGE